MSTKVSERVREARWKNAVRWAQKVNELLGKGCLVFIMDGEYGCETRIERPIEVRGNQLFERDPNDSGGVIWFRNDPEYDEGLYESIESWNWGHQIKAYQPVAETIKW